MKGGCGICRECVPCAALFPWQFLELTGMALVRDTQNQRRERILCRFHLFLNTNMSLKLVLVRAGYSGAKLRLFGGEMPV